MATCCVVCENDVQQTRILLPCLHSICTMCAHDIERVSTEDATPTKCLICHEAFDFQRTFIFERTPEDCCTTHNSKLVGLCEGCFELVCVECHASHATHTILSFTDAWIQMTLALIEGCEVLPGYIEILTSAIEDVRARCSIAAKKLPAEIDQIQNWFETLKHMRPDDAAMLSMRQTKLLARARMEAEADQKTLQLQADGLVELRDLSLLAFNEARAIELNSQDHSMIKLRMGSITVRRLRFLLSQKPSLQPLVRTHIQFTMSISSELLNAPIDKLGHLGRTRLYTEISKATKVFGGLGRGRGQLQKPCGITVLSTNDIVVCDQLNERLQVFNASDATFEFTRSMFCGRTKFVAVGASGGIWTTSSNLQCHSITSGFLHGVTTNLPMHGIAVHPNGVHLAVACSEPPCLKLFSPQGECLWSSPSYIFLSVGGVDKTPCGDFVVTDPESNAIRVLSSVDGQCLRSFGSNKLCRPYGVTVDSGGTVVVAERGDDHTEGRVSAWTLEGELIHQWSAVFNKAPLCPFDVAVSEEGTVFVTDSENHCIFVF